MSFCIHEKKLNLCKTWIMSVSLIITGWARTNLVLPMDCEEFVISLLRYVCKYVCLFFHFFSPKWAYLIESDTKITFINDFSLKNLGWMLCHGFAFWSFWWNCSWRNGRFNLYDEYIAWQRWQNFNRWLDGRSCSRNCR